MNTRLFIILILLVAGILIIHKQTQRSQPSAAGVSYELMDELEGVEAEEITLDARIVQ